MMMDMFLSMKTTVHLGEMQIDETTEHHGTMQIGWTVLKFQPTPGAFPSLSESASTSLHTHTSWFLLDQ